ncbi:MAG: hypothetical protein WC923_06285, partial [Bacteroidales bacterium]
LTPHDREAFFLAEALHTHANSWCHCHHKNAKLFFLPKRSILMLTAGVTVTTKTGSFFLAEAIHAHPTRSSRCHHKNGKLFFLPRLPLSCGDSDLTPGAVPATRLPLPALVTATTNHREPRRTYTKKSRLFVVAVTSDPYNYLQW